MLSFQRLKNLWMVWLALLLPTLSVAQLSVSFSGVVTNQGAPVANHTIFYVVYGSSGFPVAEDSTFTNPNGFYSVGPISTSGPQIVGAFVYTFGCNGAFLADTLAFTPANPVVSQVDFSLCGTSSPCDASFNFFLGSSTGQVTFFPNFIGAPGLQYQWSFGDGNFSSVQVPSYQYASPGVYTVCLTVSGQGCLDSVCQTVVVPGGGAGCDPSFFANVIGSTVLVDAIIGSNLLYHWDFGDGTTGQGGAINQHTYSSPGFYQICLTVSNTTSGCVDSMCQTVLVTGVSGLCDAIFTANVIGNSVLVGAGTGAGLQYLWNFGDGTLVSGGAFYQHTYATPGIYQVCLTVSDTLAGCVDSFCQQVLIGQQANCLAGYTFNLMSAGQVSFVATPSGVGPYTYLWDFGDSATSTLDNPVHQYTAPGHYLVCVTITDSLGCVSTYCNAVPVFNIGGNCDPQFIVSAVGGNTLNFLAFNSSPSSIHTWDFGDGNSITGTFAPFHTYQIPGQYQVCHTVYDSLTLCVDTQCEWVQVGGQTNCFAAISATIDTTGTVTFASLSQGQGPLTYHWTFGDGDSSTLGNPVHTYVAPGLYQVCLTISDSVGCTNTHCEIIPVFFQVVNPGNSISGVVFFDSTIVVLPTHMEVYLIQHDSLSGALTAVDTQFVQTPFYQFTNVAPGSYLVKATLTPSAPAFAQYLPTYFGDELFWFDALSIVMTNNSLFLPPINLIPGNNSFGPGFIAGLVVQGANKTDDPMMGVSIILTDAQNNPITGLLTDVNGEFMFQNLPYGTYHVYVEIPGKQGEHWVITLDANTPGQSLVDFVVNSQGIWRADGTTSIGDRILAGVNVFPNPFTDYLEVNFEQGAEAEGTVRLVDAQGRTLTTRIFDRGVSEIRMEVSELPVGMYLLYIQSGDQVKTTQVIRR